MREYVAAVVGGLLASSCCLVQLVLNAFSISCVGLNIIFEPYRRYFFWLSLLGLSASFLYHVFLPWWRACHCALMTKKKLDVRPHQSHQVQGTTTATRHRPQWLPFSITAAIVILLAYSPEMLDYMMQTNPTPLHTSFYYWLLAQPIAKTCDATLMKDPNEPKTRILVNIEGMHCKACVAKARSALHSIYECAHVFLDQLGPGNITIHADEAMLFTDECIIAAINEAKFKAVILRRERITEAVPPSADQLTGN